MPFFPQFEPKKWSQKMDDLYNEEVHQKVLDHQRTSHAGNLNPLGYPYGHIQPCVLKNGRAKFTEGYEHVEYGKIDKYDKVLLYCYFNLRGHFHSSVDHFNLEKDLLTEFLAAEKPYVIDIGCGPATSALALAEVFPNQPFRYLGVDCAKAMRDRGVTLLTSAKKKGILHKDTTFSFYSKWGVLPSMVKQNAVLFNFAFFFAAESLDDKALTSLAEKVERIGTTRADKRILISYTNSVEPVANTKYARFLELAQITPTEGRSNQSVTYHQRRNGAGTPGKQPYSHELYPLIYS